ncbi:ABC transporter ATP-binding protein [bacterium CPR1]|nr:ABC transporter ATP-binding protein [bacterium CPR1]
MIRARSVSFAYGPSQALNELEFEVPEGEVFGLVGPDGAGKTTLLKLIAGILPVQQGELLVMGEDVGRTQVLVRQAIGYIPQRFSLYRDLTVEENVDFFARLYPAQPDFQKNKEQLLEMVDLARFKKRLADQLSGGMKQKLALLCSLIHRPRLLLMDEPTTGVDPVSRREFWGLVFELQKAGLTVMASTPYMDEAEQFDRVALIHQGRFVRLGSTDQIRASLPGYVLEVECDAPFRARAALPGYEVELFGDRVHVFVSQLEGAVESVTRLLEKSSIRPSRVEHVPYSIEDVFLRVTA